MVRLFFRVTCSCFLLQLSTYCINNKYYMWLVILWQVTQLLSIRCKVLFLKRTVGRDDRSGCDLSSSHWHEITGNCQQFTVSEDTAIFWIGFPFQRWSFFVTDFEIYAIICIINRPFFYKNATKMHALVAWIVVWGGRLDLI